VLTYSSACVCDCVCDCVCVHVCLYICLISAFASVSVSVTVTVFASVSPVHVRVWSVVCCVPSWLMMSIYIPIIL